MIAKCAWTYDIKANISKDHETAEICIDMEMLEKIMSVLEHEMSLKADTGRYEELRAMLDDYLKLAQMRVEWVFLQLPDEEQTDE